MRLGLSSAAWLGCVLALFGSTLSSRAQTLGQQVSPQPVGAPQAGDNPGNAANPPSLNGYGQQAPSAPLNLPGTTPMNDNRAGVFGTGSDIPQTSPSTQIIAGDLLDIIVFETPELSGRFRVNINGDILLPLAGTLHVGGSTLSEITEAVTKRFKDAGILVNPQVTVFVAEYTRRTITITGEVRAPGLYPIAAPRTLIDTLTMAGGLNDVASRTVSIVHAADPKNIIHVTLNVGAQTPESIEQGRMEILPGDLIFIARSGIIYVVGELARPGGYQVEHNNRLTLLDAVALAGGPTRVASLANARLIRRSATGREELKINMKRILFGDGPDMLLTDGDILYVPTSLAKQYSFSALDASIGAATSYAIFRISQF
jgi:polysaccharide export outer membrane protein